MIKMETVADKKLKTPYYLFDLEALKKRATEIKEIISTFDGGLCFAIKANPFLLPALTEVVDTFEVCSPGELEICRKYHLEGKRIVFSGVVKTKENIQTALAYPVGIITIESIHQWELLKECMKEFTGEIAVLLRMSSGAQFGMENAELRTVLKESMLLSNVNVVGFHYFTGTQKKGNKYENELEMLFDYMETAEKEFELKMPFLEYGPGLSVPYFVGDSFDGGLHAIQAMAKYICEKNYNFKIVVELGRYIAAECGYYVTQILDIKSTKERNYCLVDGGIHHVNYYGSNMAMRTPVIEHVGIGEEEEKTEKEYMICGSLCTFADILVRGLKLSAPQIGDRLIFKNIGAYSVTEGNYLFLSRDLPIVYSYDSVNDVRMLRNRLYASDINFIN